MSETARNKLNEISHRIREAEWTPGEMRQEIERLRNRLIALEAENARLAVFEAEHHGPFTESERQIRYWKERAEAAEAERDRWKEWAEGYREMKICRKCGAELRQKRAAE